MTEYEYISLDYDRVLHQTDMAVCLDFGDLEQWIPLSLIDPEFLPLDENGGEVAVAHWFVQKEGLEDYES